ncbi:MAG: outer membrane beta-barrel protein [Sphingobacteriaceae bacterium]|nr:outer membrane beta-barrel protein [Sphingobacteriaceae bacterium]
MDKELIEHITAQLKNHEETYPDGAWERFSEKENKKRNIVYWPFWAAAALILVFGGVFFTLNNSGQKTDLVITKHKVPQHSSTDLNNSSPIKNSTDQLNETTTVLNNLNATKIPNKTIEKTNLSHEENKNYGYADNQEDLVPVNRNLLDDKLAGHNISAFSSKNFEILTEKKKAVPNKKVTFEELLAQDSRANQHKTSSKTTENSKWQPDVYVAPAMGNDNKVNMNYGFSLSYAIANRLSISSGISYASISATESLDASAPQTLSGKNLASVDAKVRGINVPLELKYNISDKLYTNIGVSALAVLNNSQQNSYIVNQVQSFSSPAVNGYADSKTMIVKEKTVEPQPEASIDPDKYIGFYNFSLGYKQKISKKNNIAIEPFLRLPMKTFSKENLNLTNGGLRLKIDF